MYCKKCGTKLQEGQKFCPTCGTPVNASGNGAEETDQQYYQQDWQQYQQDRQQYQQYSQYQYQGEIPGRNDAIASMILGIVAIFFWFFWFLGWTSLISIVLAVIGLILASNSKKKGYEGGMQTAGFILSIVSLFGGILIFIACIACTGLGISILSLSY